LARLSGSGATCFGIFSSEEESLAAAEKILDAHPAWWLRACILNRVERY
jgi:4-diphosphocytidyl-2-C-methyl-D-erythritol kinase